MVEEFGQEISIEGKSFPSVINIFIYIPLYFFFISVGIFDVFEKGWAIPGEGKSNFSVNEMLTAKLTSQFSRNNIRSFDHRRKNRAVARLGGKSIIIGIYNRWRETTENIWVVKAKRMRIIPWQLVRGKNNRRNFEK